MAQGSVTITVAYPVTPGDEEDFDAWSRLRLAESAEQPGYLGGEVLAPTRPGPNWLIVHRFDDERSARRWEAWFADSPGAKPATAVTWTTEDPAPTPDPPTQPGLSPLPSRPTRSQTRAQTRSQARAQFRPDPEPPMPRRSRRRAAVDLQEDTERSLQQEAPRLRRNGDGLEDTARTGRREPALDMLQEPPSVSLVGTALITLVAVFLSAALFDAVLQPFLQGLPALVRTAALAVVVTAAVTAVMTQSARRRLRNWLVPIAIRERWQLSEEPVPRGRGFRRKREPGGFRFREPYV